jgi:hypothetical protein
MTTSSIDSDTSIGELLTRAADLKGELVAFAQSPRFARRLDTVLFEMADRYGYLDEGTGVLVSASGYPPVDGVPPRACHWLGRLRGSALDHRGSSLARCGCRAGHRCLCHWWSELGAGP